MLAAIVSLAGCKQEDAVPLTGEVINVYNWGEYISNGEDGSLDVNKEFTRRTGIKVNYTTYPDNESMYAKLTSGSADYDVIIPSDYMIARLIEEDMLEPLNMSNIPNFSLIDDQFKGLEYDPSNKYSVAYTWGTVGIFYNKTMVDEEDVKDMSWDILWNEKYRGQILMFDNPRDAFGIALLKLGYSLNTTDKAQLLEAANLLKEQKPLVQAYVMDQIFDKMAGAEAALAPYYSGDALTMFDDNEDLGFAVPKEGTNRFVDAICIPKGAKNKELAEKYINFLCETDIALANAEYIGYSTPNTGALEQLDEEIKNNEIFYPGDDILSKTQIFLKLPDDINRYMDTLWIEIKTEN
jgi:spermidine/putrescine transport system substrate-binding protein